MGGSFDNRTGLSGLIAALNPGTQPILGVVRDHEPLAFVISLTQQKGAPIVASLPSSVKDRVG